MKVKNVKYSAYISISFFVPGHLSENMLWYGLRLFIKENMKQTFKKYFQIQIQEETQLYTIRSPASNTPWSISIEPIGLLSN